MKSILEPLAESVKTPIFGPQLFRSIPAIQLLFKDFFANLPPGNPLTPVRGRIQAISRRQWQQTLVDAGILRLGDHLLEPTVVEVDDLPLSPDAEKFMFKFVFTVGHLLQIISRNCAAGFGVHGPPSVALPGRGT